MVHRTRSRALARDDSALNRYRSLCSIESPSVGIMHSQVHWFMLTMMPVTRCRYVTQVSVVCLSVVSSPRSICADLSAETANDERM